MAGAHLAALLVASRRLFAYKIMFDLKPEDTSIIISRIHPRSPPSQTLVREGSEALLRTLSERGIDDGGIYTTMHDYVCMDPMNYESHHLCSVMCFIYNLACYPMLVLVLAK